MEPEPILSNDYCGNDTDKLAPTEHRLDQEARRIVSNRNNSSIITKQPLPGSGGGAPPRQAATSPEDHLAIVLSLGKPIKQQQDESSSNTKLFPASAAGASRSYIMSYTQNLIQSTLHNNRQQAAAAAAKPTDDKVVQAIRQNMREELIKRLNKSSSNNNGTATATIGRQSPEMQAAFAKRMEELLYKTAKSLDSYADPKTLDRRLKALMDAMQKRKARKAAKAATVAQAAAPGPSTSSTPSSASAAIVMHHQQQLQLQRNPANNNMSTTALPPSSMKPLTKPTTTTTTTTTAAAAASSLPTTASSGKAKISKQQQDQHKRQVLSQILGQVRMTRVFKVIAEIKLIQLGRDVTEGNPYSRPMGPSCTKLGGCSFAVPCRGDQKAPKVVRDLFFQTAIVPAYEKTPVERFHTLPWPQLLAQGEARLAAYHEWYRQRQAMRKFSSLSL